MVLLAQLLCRFNTFLGTTIPGALSSFLLWLLAAEPGSKLCSDLVTIVNFEAEVVDGMQMVCRYCDSRP